jgi:hypothetical protein
MYERIAVVLNHHTIYSPAIMLAIAAMSPPAEPPIVNVVAEDVLAVASGAAPVRVLIGFVGRTAFADAEPVTTVAGALVALGAAV